MGRKSIYCFSFRLIPWFLSAPSRIPKLVLDLLVRCGWQKFQPSNGGEKWWFSSHGIESGKKSPKTSNPRKSTLCRQFQQNDALSHPEQIELHRTRPLHRRETPATDRPWPLPPNCGCLSTAKATAYLFGITHFAYLRFAKLHAAKSEMQDLTRPSTHAQPTTFKDAWNVPILGDPFAFFLDRCK